MSVTIQDVAREAGVSYTSAAHVLNRHDPRYSSVTRNRILGAAQRLGYRRNELARALSLRKTNCIGFVGHNLRTPITMEKVEAIATMAQKAGYHLFLAGANEEGDPALERVLIEDLLARQADGLIIHFLTECDLSYYRALQDRGIPLVLSGFHSNPGTLPMVSVDIEGGAYEATMHLLDLGHQDLALALGKRSSKIPHNRLAGCRRALRERSFDLAPGRVLTDRPPTSESVRAFTREQLTRSPRPTAILYNNDELALAGMRVILEMGLAIPGDVSVVAVDDVPWAQNTWPPLTTVRQPRAELGKAAWNLLIKRIRGDDLRGQTHLVLPAKLVIRNSTGPVPSKRRTGGRA